MSKHKKKKSPPPRRMSDAERDRLHKANSAAIRGKPALDPQVAKDLQTAKVFRRSAARSVDSRDKEYLLMMARYYEAKNKK